MYSARTAAQQTKAYLRQSAAKLYYLSGLYESYHKGRVVLLTYHRVLSLEAAKKRYVQPGMFVLDNVFEQHVGFLKEHFHVLSLRDLLDRWKRGMWDHDQRYCVITFDDGWLDNYVYASPILRRFRLPATIFLPTDFIGTSEWFWPEKVAYLMEEACDSSVESGRRASFWHEVNQLLGTNNHRVTPATEVNLHELAIDDIIERCKHLTMETLHKLISRLSDILGSKFPDQRVLLNWAEVSEMSNQGISFGSHSCSHRILTLLPLDEVRKELEQSNQVLREKRVNQVSVFCYPNGGCNKEIQALTKECGYEAAVGVRGGCEGRVPANLFEVKRISIHNDVTPTIPQFALHLLGPHL